MAREAGGPSGSGDLQAASVGLALGNGSGIEQEVESVLLGYSGRVSVARVRGGGGAVSAVFQVPLECK